MTRTPLSRSRSPVTFTHRRVGVWGGCSDGHQNVLAVGNCCYVVRCHLLSRERRFGANEGRGEWWVHIMAAAHLQLVYINSVGGANRLYGESSLGRIVWGETSMGRNAHGAKHLFGEMTFHGAKCPWGEKSINRVKYPTTLAYRVAYRLQPHLAYSSWTSPYEQLPCSR